MKKQLFIFAFTFVVGISNIIAQGENENLVENPNFEDLEGKVKKGGSIESATGWSSPTLANADLFEKGNRKPEAGLPSNRCGFENDSEEGKIYAGILAYSYNNKESLTYITTKLKSSLKKDVRYCVSFNVSLADLSKYSIKSVGAHISKKQLSFNNENPIIKQADVEHYSGEYLTEFYGWTPICGMFTAKGGEKYLTIGNFVDPNDLRPKKIKKPKKMTGTQLPYAYYYVDNIKVFPITDSDQCACASEEEENVSMVYSKAIITNADMDPDKIAEYNTAYFDIGKTILEPTAISSIKTLAEMLNKNPDLKIKVIGHSDVNEVAKAESASASAVNYKDISEKRAQKVKDQLMELEVLEDQIIVEYRDANEPAVEGDQMIDLAQNRRVEFIIVK